MKTFLPLFALLVILLMCSSCVRSNYRMLGKDSKKIENELAKYFAGHLAGNAEHSDDRSPIRLADIVQERELVWKAWKAANTDFDEEKLIGLEPLAERYSDNWHLPQELEADAVMPYYWGSKGEKPQEGFPLFVYLHGSGPKDREWEAGITLAQRFNDSPSAYFVPQMPNEKRYRWYMQSKLWAYEKLLRQAFTNGNIDANKVYFFGISEGGYGSQRLASFYADYMAGAGPMAGGEPLKNAPAGNCRNIAFSLLTGAEDAMFHRNKLTQYTKDEFERLQSEYPGSFVHRIELIPNHAHSINYSTTTPWLRQFTRNPYPKFVSWENFEMDGYYRQGFYNLAVNERSNDDASQRTYYEFHINGNNITLRADLVSYETIETDPRWGIEMKFGKNYTPATKGKLTVYLCPELVELSKDVNLTINGKKAFQGKVKLERRHLINSCALFFDPKRLYPAAIEIDLAGL